MAADDNDLCPTCNGCGEGLYSGSTCPSCHGSGHVIDPDAQDEITQAWAERQYEEQRYGY